MGKIDNRVQVSQDQAYAFADLMSYFKGDRQRALNFFHGLERGENELSGYHECLNSLPVYSLTDMLLLGYSHSAPRTLPYFKIKALVDTSLKASDSVLYFNNADSFLNGKAAGLAQALLILGIDPFDESTWHLPMPQGGKIHD